MLRGVAILILIAAAAGLRFWPGLADRRASLLGLVGLAAGLPLVAAGVANGGPGLLDGYVVGAFGALAVASRDPVGRSALGVALMVFGAALAAVLAGGSVDSAELSIGPALLWLTMALAAGALAALAVGRVVRAGLASALLLAGALVALFCLHRPSEAQPDWWGVLAGLRIDGAVVYLFTPAELGQLGQPLMVSRGAAGLLGLTALLPLLAMWVWPTRRRLLGALSALLLLGAVGMLITAGMVHELDGAIAASAADWTSTGLLWPAGGGAIHLDLLTVLPALSAFALAIGLVAQATCSGVGGQAEPEEAAASDLDAAVALGAILLGTLAGVWRELWGTGLGEGTAPLLFAVGLLLLGLKLGLPSSRGAAWGAAIVLIVGAAQLPAGVLTGMM